MLESVLRDKVTDLIVYKLFFWISVKSSEKAHNVRILTILSIITIWHKTMTSYFLFRVRQSETKNSLKKGIHTSPNLFPVPSKQQTIVRGLGIAGSCS